jgi:hypothetical protein
VLLATLPWLAACGGSPAPAGDATPSSAAAAPGCLPAGWIERDVVAIDLEAVDRPPSAAATSRVLAWRIREDDRPLYVEDAIVLLELAGPAALKSWRLLHVFRHPKAAMVDPDEWRRAQIADTPVTGVARFEAPPTAAEIEAFMRESRWNDPSDGFRVRASGTCREAWPEGTP